MNIFINDVVLFDIGFEKETIGGILVYFDCMIVVEVRVVNKLRLMVENVVERLL